MPDFTYIHPMLVHFPIALLMVGFLSETVGIFSKKEFFSTDARERLIGYENTCR
jgi:uncharacterized membrane protein